MGDDGREMIPLRLTVSNFLCYRDDVPPLDLEGIHIACLCGDNGHGKSALLDAITFALWGSSRLGDNRNHDDLIHKGQRNMRVDLEFESAGDRYRVVRRRTSRKSQGVTDLQLFIQNESGGWLAVTGNTVRDTQSLITERIRLDHETFVNTAFLAAGGRGPLHHVQSIGPEAHTGGGAGPLVLRRVGRASAGEIERSQGAGTEAGV